MNSGKFFYQQAKRDAEARKHQRHIQIKEVKFRPKIDEHDFQFKRRNVERFLHDGNKVKSLVIFRGREIVHSEIGREILNRLAVRARRQRARRVAAAPGRQHDGADPGAQEGSRAGQADKAEAARRATAKRRQDEEGRASRRRPRAKPRRRAPPRRASEDHERKPKKKGKLKLKTKRAAVKRFKVTATGKIKRGQSMKRHILTKKAPGRKRGLGQVVLVSDADDAQVKRMLLA